MPEVAPLYNSPSGLDKTTEPLFWVQRLSELFIFSQVEWGACSLHRLVHAVTVIVFILVPSGPYKLALKIVNITFVVE